LPVPIGKEKVGDMMPKGKGGGGGRSSGGGGGGRGGGGWRHREGGGTTVATLPLEIANVTYWTGLTLAGRRAGQKNTPKGRKKGWFLVPPKATGLRSLRRGRPKGAGWERGVPKNVPLGGARCRSLHSVAPSQMTHGVGKEPSRDKE